MFSCEFCKISKNPFFTEHLWATASYPSLMKIMIILLLDLRIMQNIWLKNNIFLLSTCKFHDKKQFIEFFWLFLYVECINFKLKATLAFSKVLLMRTTYEHSLEYLQVKCKKRRDLAPLWTIVLNDPVCQNLPCVQWKNLCSRRIHRLLIHQIILFVLWHGPCRPNKPR